MGVGEGLGSVGVWVGAGIDGGQLGGRVWRWGPCVCGRREWVRAELGEQVDCPLTDGRAMPPLLEELWLGQAWAERLTGSRTRRGPWP